LLEKFFLTLVHLTPCETSLEEAVTTTGHCEDFTLYKTEVAVGGKYVHDIKSKKERLLLTNSNTNDKGIRTTRTNKTKY